jgi:probable phosphoglycerate mutase
VVLCRHGLTEWARVNRYTGRTDLALLADGEDQARALGPRLDRRTFAHVWTSPLQRARDTAALAGFPDAEPDEDLCEWDYGTAEGHTTEEVLAMHPLWRLWRDGPPGGESVRDLAERADRVVRRLVAADGDVLVFAHGHILDAVTARWLEFDVAAGERFRLDPATVSVLGWHHDVRVLLEWNSHGH